MPSAVLEHFLAHFKCSFCIFSLYHCKNRRKLLKRQRIFVCICSAKLNTKNLGFLWNTYACLFCNLPRILSHNPWLDCHFFSINNNVLNLLDFIGFCKVTSVIFHKINSFLLNFCVNYSRLL